MPRTPPTTEHLQMVFWPELLAEVIRFDREEIARLTDCIRTYSRRNACKRPANYARQLDYWTHARGYLRWRVAHLEHPGRAAPSS
jgi:hypothetical protein